MKVELRTSQELARASGAMHLACANSKSVTENYMLLIFLTQKLSSL